MVLACQNINKAFAATEILRDVSFHIEEHKKTALIGVNGAGKTTLVKMLTIIIAPTSGKSPFWAMFQTNWKIALKSNIPWPWAKKARSIVYCLIWRFMRSTNIPLTKSTCLDLAELPPKKDAPTYQQTVIAFLPSA